MSSQSIGQGQGDVAAPWANLPRTPSGRRGSRFWRVTVHRWSQKAEVGLPLRRYVLAAIAVLAAVVIVAWAAYVLFFDPTFASAIVQPSVAEGSYVKAPRSVNVWDYLTYLQPAGFEVATAISIVLLILTILAMFLGSLRLTRRRTFIRFDRRAPFVAARGNGVHRELIRGLAIDRIYAIQICGHRDLFEMNLVVPLIPGRRVPLVCHDREKVLRQDARLLAAFLMVPLLDHTASEAPEAGDPA